MSNELVPTGGLIPDAPALEEVDPNSFAELLSRDPFGYSRQDRDQVVKLLRAQRAQFEKAEEDLRNGKTKSVRLPSVKKAQLGASKTTASADELGF